MKYAGVGLHTKSQQCKFRSSTRRAGENKFLEPVLRAMEQGRTECIFSGLGAFHVVVEATSTYRWLLQPVESMADRVVLAHAKKLCVIAESMGKESIGKTDKIDYACAGGVPGTGLSADAGASRDRTCIVGGR